MDETELFVVRLWHDSQRFRVALRRVDQEETLIFASADALAQHLAAVAATPPQAARPQGESS